MLIDPTLRVLICAAILLPASAGDAAAQTPLVDEDFEAGVLPNGWMVAATVPVMWRISEPGDCGMPTYMAAFNHGSACTYASSFSTAGLLSTPEFDIPSGRSLRVDFDYALELDLGPDSFELRLEAADGSVAPLVIVDSFGLLNDGALHAASFLVSDPSAFVGTDSRITFLVAGDTQGNQGLGLMFDEVRVLLEPTGTPLCFGDGTGTACPCLNFGGLGEGCSNSTGVGARLDASGSQVVAANDLQLRVSQARPNSTGMFIQGATPVAFPFKDGLLCAGNPTTRLESVQLDAGGSGQSIGSIATLGAVAPGDSRVYQLWYRDPALSPCGSGSNLSSALLVQWI